MRQTRQLRLAYAVWCEWCDPGARCVSEIDCLLSLARCATAHRMCRPQLVRENVIDIVNGRHLLQEVRRCRLGGADSNRLIYGLGKAPGFK